MQRGFQTRVDDVAGNAIGCNEDEDMQRGFELSVDDVVGNVPASKSSIEVRGAMVLAW
jgi:hypothetical protein